VSPEKSKLGKKPIRAIHRVNLNDDSPEGKIITL